MRGTTRSCADAKDPPAALLLRAVATSCGACRVSFENGIRQRCLSKPQILLNAFREMGMIVSEAHSSTSNSQPFAAPEEFATSFLMERKGKGVSECLGAREKVCMQFPMRTLERALVIERLQAP